MMILNASAISPNIRNHRRSVQEVSTRYAALGIFLRYASMLTGMDEAIAQGAEDRTTLDVQRLTGLPANTYANFLDSQCAFSR